MKVGDLVKVRRPNPLTGRGSGVGIIQAIQTKPDPAPNGYYSTKRYYKVLLNGTIWTASEVSLVLISNCDIS